jgi:hypothetical protein
LWAIAEWRLTLGDARVAEASVGVDVTDIDVLAALGTGSDLRPTFFDACRPSIMRRRANFWSSRPYGRCTVANARR